MELQALHQELANHTGDHPTLNASMGFSIVIESWHMKKDSPLKLNLLEEYHIPSIRGHARIDKTYY